MPNTKKQSASGTVLLNGDKMRRRREVLLWTQQRLADEIGMDISTVNHAENGRRVHISTARKIVTALNIKSSQLIVTEETTSS